MRRQTTTTIHTAQELLAQRTQIFSSQQSALSGLTLYAQLRIGMAMYLFGHVSTPGYLSVLLTVPAAAALYLLSAYVARRAAPGRRPLESAAGRVGERVVLLALAAAMLLDAQMALYALVSMISEVLPGIRPLVTASAVALLTMLALGGEDTYALARLARLMAWVLAAILFYCVLGAVPSGNIGHLFPLLGQGAQSVARGALWMCGCTAGVCCPMILESREGAAALTRGGLCLKKQLLGVAAAAAMALITAYVLPFYVLSRAEELGSRLMILSNSGSSVSGWSLMLCAQLFMLLIALSAAVTSASAMISCIAGRGKTTPATTAALLALLVPAAALRTRVIDEALLLIAPARYWLALAAMCAAAVFARLRGRGRETGA